MMVFAKWYPRDARTSKMRPTGAMAGLREVPIHSKMVPGTPPWAHQGPPRASLGPPSSPLGGHGVAQIAKIMILLKQSLISRVSKGARSIQGFAGSPPSWGPGEGREGSYLEKNEQSANSASTRFDPQGVGGL